VAHAQRLKDLPRTEGPQIGSGKLLDEGAKDQVVAAGIHELLAGRIIRRRLDGAKQYLLGRVLMVAVVVVPGVMSGQVTYSDAAPRELPDTREVARNRGLGIQQSAVEAEATGRGGGYHLGEAGDVK
jgi:hypothetical protein